CLRCHDPHSSYKTKGVPGLLRASGNDLCFLCHAKDAFEAKSVHAAVKQGCNTCHDPHSSDTKFVLLTDGNALCAKCHDIGSAKGIAGHSGYNVKGTRCLTCHAPHASSGDGKLRRAFVHKPFGAGECVGCHNAPDTDKPLKTKLESDKLCYSCHADAAKAYSTGKAHDPVAKGRCAECHNPHASDHKN
ncbi:MAG: cytochrome c3 family protein, partial [Deltaproteobacteria bacterium]